MKAQQSFNFDRAIQILTWAVLIGLIVGIPLVRRSVDLDSKPPVVAEEAIK